MNRICRTISVSLIALLTLAGCASEEYGSNSETREYTDWPVREERVHQNMREVQLAAEHYAADHGHNRYPTTIDDSFKCYFPGGRPGEPSVVGIANPFSGANEFPVLGHRITNVQAAREAKPEKIGLRIGQVEYTPINNGEGYAIVAVGHDGVTLADPLIPGQILVLSNLDDD